MTENSADATVTFVLNRPFPNDSGYAWLADTEVEGDGISISEYQSDLALFEDGIPLGPNRSAHGDIRNQGCGRFSHWQKSIYFSASDNTDPNTNGRAYTATVTRRNLAEDRVNYGLRLTRLFAHWLGLSEVKDLPFKDKKIFELGPGASMATCLAMAAFGGTVYVREREAIAWDQNFHGETAEKMLSILQQSHEKFDPAPLTACLDHGCFSAGRIIVLDEARSVSTAALTNAIDYTVSNSAFEHVDDLQSELSCLSLISKPSAKGAHVVDFSDHHHTEKPLEFLLLDDAEFERSCQYRFSRGSRVRPHEFTALVESVGFRINEMIVLSETHPLYLEEFISRLRQCSSRFRSTPQGHLKILSATICFEKT